MKKKREKLAASNLVIVKLINHYGTDFSDLVHARATFDRLSHMGLRPKIKDVRDYTIAGIKVREYCNDSKDPYLVYLHGGGYVLGGLKSHDTLCRRIAKYCKLRVVAIDYSLAPEHKFPTQINEGRRVIEAIQKKTGGQVYIGGDSAGGTLAAALASVCDGITAQILFYPALDGRLDHKSVERLGVKRNYITADMLRWFRAQYLNDLSELADPLANPSISTPKVPTFLVAGTRDPLLHESEVYAEKVRAQHLPCELVIVEGALHGFMQFPRRFGYKPVLDKLSGFLESLDHRT